MTYYGSEESHKQALFRMLNPNHPRTRQFYHNDGKKCPHCGNETKGTREGDTEYCTVCGHALGPAHTKTGDTDEMDS